MHRFRTVVGRFLRVEVVDPEVVVDLAVRVGVARARGVVKRLSDSCTLSTRAA